MMENIQTTTIQPEHQAVQETQSWQNPLRDSVWITGLVFVLITLGLYLFGMTSESRVMDGVMPLNMFLLGAYTVFLWINKRLKWWLFGAKKEYYGTFFLYLTLWLISCFSLNQTMDIFSESCTWLGVHLTLSCMACCLYPWRENMLPTMRKIWVVALVMSAVLFLYFALYLLPLYPVSALVFWLFGLSLHTFIPLVFFIHVMRILKDEFQIEGQSQAVWAGVGIPFVFIALFCMAWAVRLPVFWQNDVSGNPDLPHSIRMAQRVPNDWLSEMMLKSDLSYQVIDEQWSDMMGGFNRNFKKRHDPLVVTASLVAGLPEISNSEKIELLQGFFDVRHETEDRLWNGRDLRTTSVDTKMEVHPDLRFAYIEKTMDIHNSGKDADWRPNTQEALYTFYLPEGAVVTSLSLWINGVEEKGRLSAKSKAEAAYTTIVGRERRDPALVSWREGNTVTVRVFPCTPSEKRTFKIGITAPLKVVGEQLVLENFYFQGPPATGVQEQYEIHGLTSTENIAHLPSGFKQKEGVWTGALTFQPNWNLILKKTEINPISFAFNGKSYAIEPVLPKLEPFSPKVIYLDVNRNFSKNDLKKIKTAAGETPIFVHQDSALVALENADVERLLEQRFSLFPVHEINNSDEALLITHSRGSTPNFSELKGSVFGKKMAETLHDRTPIRIADLGEFPTDYMHSFSAFRLANAHKLSIPQALQCLESGQFLGKMEDDHSVHIPNTDIRIRQTQTADVERTKNAPDHLLRLFAYNDILKKIGPQFLMGGFENPELVEQAKEAYVVSPLSSLVVLETQADYDRFGIEKAGENSLGNAGLTGAGGVPEPHEWALIILAAVFLLVAYRRISI